MKECDLIMIVLLFVMTVAMLVCCFAIWSDRRGTEHIAYTCIFVTVILWALGMTVGFSSLAI